MAVRVFPRGAYVGLPRYWLVEVAWAGQVWRVSSEELEVDLAGGGTYLFSDGLDPLTITEEIELGAEAVSAITATITALLPADVPRLVAQGHRLTAARVEVSRWVEGTTYEARRRMLTGRAKEASYDVATGLIRISVEQAVIDDAAEAPDPTAQVDDTTFDETDQVGEADYGRPYPIIIGQPGRAQHLVRGYVPASRAAWGNKGTHEHEAVVAGHPVGVEQVILLTDDDDDGVRLVVERTTDLRGRVITRLPPDYPASQTIDSLALSPLDRYYSGLEYSGFSAGSALIPATASDLPLYVAWYDLTNLTAGGVRNERGEMIRGAGDVIVYLLGYTSLRVDREAFEGVRGLLAGYLIDAVIDDRVKAWEWLVTHVLAILPLSLRSTPWGVSPVVWHLDPLADDAIAELDADTDPRIEIGDVVDYEVEPIYNDVRVSYTFSRAAGAYQSRVTCGPVWVADDDDTVVHPLAAASVGALYEEGYDTGLRPLTVESDVLYDRATAHRVAADKVAAYALPRRTVPALVPEDRWDWLRLGDRLRLVSADHHFAGQRAILTGMEWGDDGELGLRLRLVERPADARYAQAGAA